MATPAGKILPPEYASNMGHLRTIKSSHVQRLLRSFEKVDGTLHQVGEVTGHIDLSTPHPIKRVFAVDGSFLTLCNLEKPGSRLGLLQVGLIGLDLSELRRMASQPLSDPREKAATLEKNYENLVWPLPLSGLALPGMTVLQTVRALIHEFFEIYGLYETLNFFVSRLWLPNYQMREHMACIGCRGINWLPRNQLHWHCPHCGQHHTLSDYLQLVENISTDWAVDGVIAELTSVAEHLLLLEKLVEMSSDPQGLTTTLFVQNGPLVLRSELCRLIFGVRAYFDHLKEQGLNVHYVGVEKTGALVNHLPVLAEKLTVPGDYFLPSVRYLDECLKGVAFNPNLHCYRTQYGNKVVVRLGSHHTVALTVPTGQFCIEPEEADLLGFTESMRALSELLSSSYENALLPLVLANRKASISVRPSRDILQRFVEVQLSKAE